MDLVGFRPLVVLLPGPVVRFLEMLTFDLRIFSGEMRRRVGERLPLADEARSRLGDMSSPIRLCTELLPEGAVSKFDRNCWFSCRKRRISSFKLKINFSCGSRNFTGLLRMRAQDMLYIIDITDIEYDYSHIFQEKVSLFT